MSRVRSIDPTTLPKHFDSAAAEARWHDHWDRLDVFKWDASRPREETFIVDTPPPTVSGSLHVGHVFSYTQADVIARYRRMRGDAVFYPMGWDDNGLPTERRVQNYFNVRCDPRAPVEAHLDVPPAPEKSKEPPRLVSRPNFIELCLKLTVEDEKAFKALWRRLGLSIDWREEYSTIDERCRHLAQLSFRDLWEKGHLYTVEAPTMWDPDFQTAVAQAEVEDRPTRGAFHHVAFDVEGGGEFTVATTRPELLAACVGVTAHPDDARFKPLFGKRAITPLFRVPVPIFPSELADPEKGTGILMVCTFGDATDVLWWREQKLALRQIVGRDGRLVPVEFGTPGWESVDAAAANAAYARIQSKGLNGARQVVVEMLREAKTGSTGSTGTAPLRGEPKPIEHAVKYYEKGDRPLEFISTRQWFVRLLDKKDALLAKGDEVGWHPDFMRLRYRNWTENLNVDWCVSRQRYFGVPIPVWYPLDAQGQRDYEHPIVADRAALPVDPTSDVPPGYRAEQREQPNGFSGETDIFDTWFTSSLTPQISSKWLLDPERHKRLFPADVRPQSHEIIRTWAFYTIAKALLHEDSIPWKHAIVSGWILDPDRKKMSKSRGNVVTPMHLLDEYGSDGVRYWAASARLGTDTAFDDKVFKVGKRLATKLFNAGKFVLQQEGDVAAIDHELDRAFVARLRALVERVTKLYDEFEYAHALQETETFFWRDFTDTYLELVKVRVRDVAGGGSARAALRLGLSVLLRLFAPVLPYITEEVWSWAFAEETDRASIHAASWPGAADFAAIAAPADATVFDAAVACLAAINKAKSEGGVSVGRGVRKLRLRASEPTVKRLAPATGDVMASARVEEHVVEAAPGPVDDEFLVTGIEFVEQAETT